MRKLEDMERRHDEEALRRPSLANLVAIEDQPPQWDDGEDALGAEPDWWRDMQQTAREDVGLAQDDDDQDAEDAGDVMAVDVAAIAAGDVNEDVAGVDVNDEGVGPAPQWPDEGDGEWEQDEEEGQDDDVNPCWWCWCGCARRTVREDSIRQPSMPSRSTTTHFPHSLDEGLFDATVPSKLHPLKIHPGVQNAECTTAPARCFPASSSYAQCPECAHGPLSS